MKQETFEYLLILALICVVAWMVLTVSGCSQRRDPCVTWSPDIQQNIQHYGCGCP